MQDGDLMGDSSVSKRPRYYLRDEMRGWTIIDRVKDARVGIFYRRADARLCREALNAATAVEPSSAGERAVAA